MKKALLFTTVLINLCLILGCNNQRNSSSKNAPSDITYENELFSITIPHGWMYNDSAWGGLYSMQNDVKLYDPNSDLVWLRCVKTFLPFWDDDIEQAKEMALLGLHMRQLNGEDVELYAEEDSLIVGGRLASILYIGCYNEDKSDTIIQKQIITYTRENHVLYYFNEIFNIKDFYEAQDVGDAIIGTLKLKVTSNPLDNDSIFLKAIDDAVEKGLIDEGYTKSAMKFLEESRRRGALK